MVQETRRVNSPLLTIPLIILLALLFGVPHTYGAHRPKQLTEPDYTKGEKLEGRLNHWSLGPMGAIGNIWANSVGDGTRKTRMIQIAEVMKGTPADGVLQVNDVILGVDGKKFDSDPRRVLATAVTSAEKKENGGKLELLIWRKGKEQAAKLQLKVMGTFSETSPWECEKSKAIIDAACAAIVKRGLFSVGRDKKRRPNGGIPNLLSALGLLATGEDQYLPLVREYARAIGKPDVKLDLEPGMKSWPWAYTNLFLTEYFLATGDEYVLPAITEYSTKIAMGSSGVGTWGHGLACPSLNGGKLHGPTGGYGAMNQVSLTLTMSLVLAQKCGIKNDEVDQAVNKSASFFRWFLDKGAIPYGDHKPWIRTHDNNGVCSQAAVLFDLLGDKTTTEYYTRMAGASYDEREPGHTGHFLAWQWGALGAARGGVAAARSFVKRTQWFTELERRYDGQFIYQAQLDNADHGKYTNWATTGSRLMQFCLPRKKLFVTGKGGACIAPIEGQELQEVVAAGAFHPDANVPTSQLLESLGSWSPCVRNRAAMALGKREENVVDALIAMLDSPNRYARYGACEALNYAGRGSAKAVDLLIAKIQDSDDMTLRYYAVNALRLVSPRKYPNTLGEVARKSIPALLKLAATDDPEQDPQRKLHNEIAGLLFYSGNVQGFSGFFKKGNGLSDVDRKLLIPAIKSILTNPNGGARSLASGIYPYLTAQDLEQLWGDVYYATKNRAPSGVMFAGGVRTNGLKLMAKHGVKEGMEVGVDIVARQKGWGDFGRKCGGFPALKSYGPALEPYFPEFEKAIESWAKMKNEDRQKKARQFTKLLEEMKQMPTPKLISIKAYLKNTPKDK